LSPFQLNLNYSVELAGKLHGVFGHLPGKVWHSGQHAPVDGDTNSGNKTMDHEFFEPTIKTSIDKLDGPVENPASLVEVSSQGETKWVLDRSIIIIGSDDAADVKIEGEGIAAYHAEVVHDDGDYYVRHLEGSAPVCVGGDAVCDSVLADGNTIAIGEHTFTFRRQTRADAPE
jgi:hypothetical protein